MLLFEQAIKSEATKKAYLYQLNKFKEWAEIKNFDGLLQAPQKDIQILLEDYTMYLKKTISANSFLTLSMTSSLILLERENMQWQNMKN